MVSNHKPNREDRLPDVTRNLAALIEALHQTDERLHKMISMEFWSLAHTMDELEPGFWSQYMENRQKIFEQYIKERQKQQKQATSPLTAPSVSRRESPFKDKDVPQTDVQTTQERISVFSDALDSELSQMRRYARRW